MQQAPSYDDVVDDVVAGLRERLVLAAAAGIAHEQCLVDPGLGFGKRLDDNLRLLRRLSELRVLGCPVLVGPSRKSFIGGVLDAPVVSSTAFFTSAGSPAYFCSFMTMWKQAV